MKILVTGGCGVIGSLFTREMVAQGHQVNVIDHCEEPRNRYIKGQLLDLGVAVTTGRLENSIIRCEHFDLILHAAAFTGIPSSAQDPDDDWISNVDATRHLLKLLRICSNPPKTVIVSSVKPYSLKWVPYQESETRYTPDTFISEEFPLSPDEPYAASKMAQSGLALAYARTYDLPITVFRCSNLYGAAPSHGPRHGWLTWFAISAAIGRPLYIQGNGKQTRDMLHSSDVTSAVMAAYNNWDKVQGELFNVGGGSNNTISVMEAAHGIQMLSGCEIIKDQPGRKHEDPVFVTDFTKFKNATGWEPKTGVSRGVAEVYNWSKKNKDDLIPLYEGL